MTKNLALILALVLAAGAALRLQARETDSKVTNNRFTFDFETLDGKRVTHEDPRFKGKVIMVDIFGSWCSPCRKLTPFTKSMYDKYHAAGLEIVGIAFEQKDEAENRKELERYIKEFEVPYTVLYGGRTAQRPAKLRVLEKFDGYPTSIFIGRDGVVRKLDVGLYPDTKETIERTIKELLAEKAP